MLECAGFPFWRERCLVAPLSTSEDETWQLPDLWLHQSGGHAVCRHVVHCHTRLRCVSSQLLPSWTTSTFSTPELYTEWASALGPWHTEAWATSPSFWALWQSFSSNTSYNLAVHPLRGSRLSGLQCLHVRELSATRWSFAPWTTMDCLCCKSQGYGQRVGNFHRSALERMQMRSRWWMILLLAEEFSTRPRRRQLGPLRNFPQYTADVRDMFQGEIPSRSIRATGRSPDDVSSLFWGLTLLRTSVNRRWWQWQFGRSNRQLLLFLTSGAIAAHHWWQHFTLAALHAGHVIDMTSAYEMKWCHLSFKKNSLKSMWSHRAPQSRGAARWRPASWARPRDQQEASSKSQRISQWIKKIYTFHWQS